MFYLANYCQLLLVRPVAGSILIETNLITTTTGFQLSGFLTAQTLSEYVSKVLVLKLCLVQHACFITSLFIRRTIDTISTPIHSEHVNCGDVSTVQDVV